jgi:hypothetical protein
MLRLCTFFTVVATAAAWTTGSAVSSFSGSVLFLDRPNVAVLPRHSAPQLLTMKKGKANVPPQMRSQYAKQQEMMAVREQMIAATKPGADGLPVFNLFVRTTRANVRVTKHTGTQELIERCRACLPLLLFLVRRNDLPCNLPIPINTQRALAQLNSPFFTRCGTHVEVSRVTNVPRLWPRIMPMAV